MERATIFYSDKSRWTDNELMSLPRDGRKYELIEGELLMSPVGRTHSLICLRLATLLVRFVEKKRLGEVFDSSMGFRLSPKILLSPDVSYVSKARLKKSWSRRKNFFTARRTSRWKSSRRATNAT